MVEVLISILILSVIATAVASGLTSFLRMNLESQRLEIANRLSDTLLQSFLNGKLTATGDIDSTNKKIYNDISVIDSNMNSPQYRLYKSNMSVIVYKEPISGTTNQLNKIWICTYYKTNPSSAKATLLSQISAIVK